ncbi:hypothetical protein EV361DRAFT_1001805 [Lentinula raphanica]|nr:hypothetical protein EV361DRAFT_1001805 [Lentinula raphanica]
MLHNRSEASPNVQVWVDHYKANPDKTSSDLPDPIVSSIQEGDDPKHDPDYEPDEPDASNSKEGNQLRRSKWKRPFQAEPDSSSGNPPHPPPGGGAGGAGGSGGSGSTGNTQSGSTTGSHAMSTSDQTSDEASTGKAAKRARQKSADVNPKNTPFYDPIPTTPPQHPKADNFGKFTQESVLPSGQFSSPASISSSVQTPSLTGSYHTIDSSGGSIQNFGIPSHQPYSPPLSPTAIGHKYKGSKPTLMNPSILEESVASVQDIISTNIVAVSAFQTADLIQSLPASELHPFIVEFGGIILNTCLKWSNKMNWAIWRGSLVLEGLNAEHIQIVIKIAEGEHVSSELEGTISNAGKVLLSEAKCYEFLANIDPESEITPHYYGVFQSSSGSVALVLEDDGKRLPRGSLSSLNDSEKHKLFETAQELHGLGVLHGDLEERNIVADGNGKFHIIDFQNSIHNHQNGCEELEQFAAKMGLDFEILIKLL